MDDPIEKCILDTKKEIKNNLEKIRKINKEIIERVKIIKIIRKKNKIEDPAKIKRKIKMLENKISTGLPIKVERELFEEIKKLKSKLNDIKNKEGESNIKKFDEEIKKLKKEREEIKKLLDKERKELRDLEKAKKDRDKGGVLLGDLATIKKKNENE